MKGNPKLKAWFKWMSAEARAEWLGNQKELSGKWQARQWDDGEIVSEERHYVRKGEDVIFDFVPLREWIKEERALGFTTAQAIESFKAAWKDPKARTMLHDNIQHVAIYRGIRSTTGHGEDRKVSDEESE